MKRIAKFILPIIIMVTLVIIGLKVIHPRFRASLEEDFIKFYHLEGSFEIEEIVRSRTFVKVKSNDDRQFYFRLTPKERKKLNGVQKGDTLIKSSKETIFTIEGNDGKSLIVNYY